MSRTDTIAMTKIDLAESQDKIATLERRVRDASNPDTKRKHQRELADWKAKRRQAWKTLRPNRGKGKKNGKSRRGKQSSTWGF